MKKLFLLTLLLLPLPTSAYPRYIPQADEVRNYDVCTRNREVYVPGTYDRYGRYVPGYVTTESYNVPCGGYVAEPVPVRPRVVCDPSRTLLGMTLGGGVGAALSRGEGRWWAIPLGATVGGAAFGCN
jgi:hypothetical protein